MTDFDVEYVPCCVCHETGKVARFVFFKKDCPVCRGKGERPILIAKNLTGYDRAAVRQSAIIGSLNYIRSPSPLESIVGQTFGGIF